MSKLIYQQKKGGRVKYGFIGVTTQNCDDLWFSEKDGKLKMHEDCKNDGEGFSSHCRERVRSVKAFIRFINKHKDELPIGGSFILVSRWVKHNVSWTKFK